MTINPNQWIDTQNLLVLLAQALSPTMPLDLTAKAAIASQVFTNFYRPSLTRPKFEAKLLPTLQTAATEMERLIENYSLQRERPMTPLPKTTKSLEMSNQKAPSQELPKNFSTEPRGLLQQVRIAIGELTSSKYQDLPPSLPLSILTKLKPMVDSYIQNLSQQKQMPKTAQATSLKNPVQITNPTKKKIFPFSPKNQEITPKEEQKTTPKTLPEQSFTRPILKEKKQPLPDLKFIPASTPQNPKLPAPDVKPIIPFPTVYPLPTSLTKKKKRKRYFFKDGDEEEDNEKNQKD